MEKLGLNEIREKYLSFYEGKEHLRLPSFSLVPQDDPSLLLINAGMAPLKNYFTGKVTPPKKRVTTCQKCIRTPDIERVGKTARHGTFFEMLGNFSFGDYFKHEATRWAWEFSTEVMKLPEDRIYISVYEEDDEAYDIWTKEIGIKEDHMVRFGKEDNFWEIGTGPCGPCSELYFDRGEKYGCGSPDCKVGCECDRFIEYWNLVFTQFDKQEDGTYERLANPNIDTGMGLERLAVIMQDVNNLFEVDTIQNIMKHVSKLANVNYKDNEKTDVSLRVITDHIRSTVFMVSDGVGPSNEGRGYVLRRLLRRAARHGRLLGITDPFLYVLADTVINESKEAYPALAEKSDYIKKVIKIEEERFSETIDSGLNILNQKIDELVNAGEKILSGDDAFRLYDTYGFPIDLTVEILEEKGLSVDMDAFTKAMNDQKTRSREGRKVGDEAAWSETVYQTLDKSIVSEFVGYDSLELEDAKVLCIVKDDKVVDSVADGEDAVVILDKTVIYGASGGQMGDKGELTADGVQVIINDAKKLGDGKILHFVTVNEGMVSTGDVLSVKADADKRMATARNHSTTHLLQKALQEVLGSHIEQAGSYVDENRLRFDFSHFEAVSAEALKEVEKRVNKAILAAYPIECKVMPIEEAKKLGAMALFSEKYGDTVRVVNMGGYSIEFCGGTHLTNTSQAGLFKLISESGVAAGVRRIEGITGEAVLDYILSKDALIENVAKTLGTTEHDVADRAVSVVGQIKEYEKKIDEFTSKMANAKAASILDSATKVGDVNVYVARMDSSTVDDMRKLSDAIKDKDSSAVVVLVALTDGKITFIASVAKDALAKKAHAGNIIREITAVCDGRGGGKPDMAQGGGQNAAKIDEAIAMVCDIVSKQVG